MLIEYLCVKMQQIIETIYENSLNEGVPDVVRLFGVRDASEVDYIRHPKYDPQANMDIDTKRAEESVMYCRPMLRLYSWKPFAVSLGAHQKENDIDKNACVARGYSIVRRPTGGRAILHAAELTYSLVVPLTTKDEPHRTVHDIYRNTHLLLLKALHKLGAKGIDFQKSQTDFRALYRSGQVSMPCFASSARYELMYEGRKIVGSAQRLYGSTVLQHGSILLDTGHEGLADILNLDNETERETIRKVIHSQSATLRESCNQEISWETCADAIEEVFKGK